MADQKGLRAIGFGFAMITAAVVMIAWPDGCRRDARDGRA